MLGHGTGRHKGLHLACLATEGTDDEYSIFNIEYSRLLPSLFVSRPFRIRLGGRGNKFRERVAGVRGFRVFRGHTLIGEPVRGNGSDPRRIPGAHPLSHESRPDEGALGQGIVLKDAPAPSPGSLARDSYERLVGALSRSAFLASRRFSFEVMSQDGLEQAFAFDRHFRTAGFEMLA